MNLRMRAVSLYFVATAALLISVTGHAEQLSIAGITMNPHMKLDTMEYRQPSEPAEGGLIYLFLRNTGESGGKPILFDVHTRVKFDGKSPEKLLDKGLWAWHDTPETGEHFSLPSGAMTVWTVNGRRKPFGPGGRVSVAVRGGNDSLLSETIALDAPEQWISAVTFLGSENSVYPDRMVVHLVNNASTPLELRGYRLWLPPDPKSPRVFVPQSVVTAVNGFNAQQTIPAGDHGGFIAQTGPLPLTYVVVEIMVGAPGKESISLWSHLRIKSERFDISGGWVNGDGNPVSKEPFLKALKRIHVNTAHLAETHGYSDTDLYTRFPLKYFNALTPFEKYDTDAQLPRIHAVEFLGEPQYGGGRPVPPQEVWQKLRPYTVTRLATTVTHSEERIWRDYAGLSDYPHYDAYRVTAPSPDVWRKYDRWDGKRIGWGAPLETIGDMCRSLRELNRPMPCAIWSQGPSSGWDEYGGRKRTSPTPDEIRLQAYHAISTRITSLYWFNLSLDAFINWRDTIDELGRVGRELRMLDSFLLEGNAYQFERLRAPDGKLDWDLASVCGPRAAMLFALDLAYVPDPDARVFTFSEPRPAQWRFRVPSYLGTISDVFRVDADGVYPVSWTVDGNTVIVNDTQSRVAVYFATPDPALRNVIEARRQELIAYEDALAFDPARSDADYNQLVDLRASK